MLKKVRGKIAVDRRNGFASQWQRWITVAR